MDTPQKDLSTFNQYLFTGSWVRYPREKATTGSSREKTTKGQKITFGTPPPTSELGTSTRPTASRAKVEDACGVRVDLDLVDVVVGPVFPPTRSVA